ncbi:MAG: hypothetical protein DRP87_11355 [Spirochaetes bacterium]|nr:MAG: hypothetical protein DRP87_11355 [Spirochaetota bacterium]
MTHCTVYCPTGLVANILGKISPWRLKTGSECDVCGKCSNVCRYNALQKVHLERKKPGLTCTLCGDCTDSCNRGAIYYSFPGLSPGGARRAFVVTITVLHAVFLAAARI